MLLDGTIDLTAGEAFISRVERVRARYKMDVLVLVAAAVTPILFVIAWTGRWNLLGTTDQPLGMFTIAVLLAIAATGAFLLFRTPRLDHIARQADQRLKLAERLGSAANLLQKSKNMGSGVLESALLGDALRHSDGLSRFRLGVPTGLVPLLSILTITLTASIFITAANNSSLTTSAGTNAPPEQPASVEILSNEQIEQVRDLLAVDAERLDNPYLGAISASFRHFAEEASGMPAEEGTERLVGLLSHAATAYGASRPSWLPPDVGNFSALSAALERHAASAMQAALPPPAESVPLPDEWDPNSQDPSLRSADALQNLLAQSGAGTSSGPLLPADGPRLASGSMPPLNDFEPKPLDPGKLLAASPAGASLNADEGASSTAGLGKQVLAGAQGDIAQPGFGAEMKLTAESSAPGNLIRIEVAPRAEYTSVDKSAVPGSAAVDSRPLSPVFRKAVRSTDRPIVARFFVQDDTTMMSGS